MAEILLEYIDAVELYIYIYICIYMLMKQISFTILCILDLLLSFQVQSMVEIIKERIQHNL
jgi:hypothetical protein